MNTNAAPGSSHQRPQLTELNGQIVWAHGFGNNEMLQRVGECGAVTTKMLSHGLRSRRLLTQCEVCEASGQQPPVGWDGGGEHRGEKMKFPVCSCQRRLVLSLYSRETVKVMFYFKFIVLSSCSYHSFLPSRWKLTSHRLKAAKDFMLTIDQIFMYNGKGVIVVKQQRLILQFHSALQAVTATLSFLLHYCHHCFTATKAPKIRWQIATTWWIFQLKSQRLPSGASGDPEEWNRSYWIHQVKKNWLFWLKKRMAFRLPEL